MHMMLFYVCHGLLHAHDAHTLTQAHIHINTLKTTFKKNSKETQVICNVATLQQPALATGSLHYDASRMKSNNALFSNPL